MNNREEIARFEALEVDPDAFSHADHVRMAWCFLSELPAFEASARFDAALRRLTVKLGVPDKYHATITGFFLLLINERMARCPGCDWPAFRAANRDLVASGAALLGSHYSPDRLQSPLARRQFLLPDGATQGAATS